VLARLVGLVRLPAAALLAITGARLRRVVLARLPPEAPLLLGLRLLPPFAGFLAFRHARSSSNERH
jgi:hypothetical protein